MGSRHPPRPPRQLRLHVARRSLSCGARCMDAPHRAGQARGKSAGPIRTTPVTLLPRRSLGLWNRAVPAPAEPPVMSPRALRVIEHLAGHGACFYDEIVDATGMLRTQVEDALAELVALGPRALATAFPACARCSRRPIGASRSVRASDGAPHGALRHRRCRPLGARPAPGATGSRRRGVPARLRNRRPHRRYAAAPLRRRVLATARARGGVASAVARAAARVSPAGSARRDTRRPVRRGHLGRTVRAAGSRRSPARDAARARLGRPGSR